jgi:hypothetical protein
LTACYDAYRARLDETSRIMACTCDAYRSIGGLELKFVLHHRWKVAAFGRSATPRS